MCFCGDVSFGTVRSTCGLSFSNDAFPPPNPQWKYIHTIWPAGYPIFTLFIKAKLMNDYGNAFWFRLISTWLMGNWFRFNICQHEDSECCGTDRYRETTTRVKTLLVYVCSCGSAHAYWLCFDAGGAVTEFRYKKWKKDFMNEFSADVLSMWHIGSRLRMFEELRRIVLYRFWIRSRKTEEGDLTHICMFSSVSKIDAMVGEVVFKLLAGIEKKVWKQQVYACFLYIIV